jgi:beta-aspartyl-dipeptidase (metallo-type)
VKPSSRVALTSASNVSAGLVRTCSEGPQSAAAFPCGHVEPGIFAEDAYLQFRDAGGRTDSFTISSDGGSCLPAFDHDGNPTRFGVGLYDILPETLAGLVRASVPLAEALAPFASNVADLLKLRRMGRLGVGRDADLLVLDEDLGIRHVMARGKWNIRDGQVVRRGTYE